jgi:hypothetical protein
MPEVVTVQRREQQDGDGEEEPEPRQPVTPSAAWKFSAAACRKNRSKLGTAPFIASRFPSRKLESSLPFAGVRLVVLHSNSSAQNHSNSIPDETVRPYPERFAQEALGHNSKAVHRAYAKRALLKIPSLEDYEQRAA